jgi:Transposase DDE domain
MSCHPRVTEWTMTIQAHLPHLSKPQATVLALWSLGMVLARSCALTAVSAFLAPWLHRKEPTVRQQLREFCYDATAKRGTARCTLAVEPCFVPLLAWVVAQWEGTQLALALDATTLGTRFTVLALSVVYRGCAIPVAWTVLPATAKHAWRREWLRMLRQVRQAVPPSWTVIVLADRGLYARWLFRRITRLGWHPFLRINTGGTFRSKGHVRGVPLKSLVPEPGTAWQGTGIAFKGRHRQLHCTLLACWEAGYKDPWLILTDLPPEASTACWYGLRAWIEQSFKITKRAGWQWQRTRMTQPERAARLWLAVAVATLWLLSVGGEADEAIPASTVPEVTALIPMALRLRRATCLRLVS